MIINLKESLLDFMTQHDLRAEDVEYVGYHCQFNEAEAHCDFVDFLEVAEDINFEEYDPLIKNREVIRPGLKILADEWFISKDDSGEAMWLLHHMAQPCGDYEPITEEDIIRDIDVVDDEMRSLLDITSENGTYVRDNIEINGVEYKIENKDGIERVVNNHDCVGIILAANANGQYWSAASTNQKDPQMLFYPELIKTVMEYTATFEIPTYHLFDADIGTVFNLANIQKEYHLDTSGFNADLFNNLRVIFVPKNETYRVSYTGAANHPELRHEILLRVTPEDNIKI